LKRVEQILKTYSSCVGIFRTAGELNYCISKINGKTKLFCNSYGSFLNKKQNIFLQKSHLSSNYVRGFSGMSENGRNFLETVSSFFYFRKPFFEKFYSFFSWKIKVFLVLLYVFGFVFFLFYSGEIEVIFCVLGKPEDFYGLFKIFFIALRGKSGRFYYVLLFLSFISAIPWFPNSFRIFTLGNFIYFLFVFVCYHTIFIFFFLLVPGFFLCIH